MGHGGHSLLLDKHTLSSLSLLCWIVVSASMADYDLSCEAVDSGLFGILCCRSHTRICFLPLVSLVIKQSLLILGLIKILKVESIVSMSSRNSKSFLYNGQANTNKVAIVKKVEENYNYHAQENLNNTHDLKLRN